MNIVDGFVFLLELFDGNINNVLRIDKNKSDLRLCGVYWDIDVDGNIYLYLKLNNFIIN